MKTGQISIGYIIESLGPGGAERQLVELIKNLDRERFAPRVLTYVSNPFHRPELEALGVPVTKLERRGRWDPRPVATLAHWLRSRDVDLVHAYLYTANLYAVTARKIAGRGRIVVSERSGAPLHGGLSSWFNPWVFRTADLVISNSEASRSDLAAKHGLSAERVVFIPNGIDFGRFRPPRSEERRTLRAGMGWPEGKRVALTVASYNPCKNHEGVLDAIRLEDGNVQGIHCCWVGAMAPAGEAERVRSLIDRSDLSACVSMIGPKQDVVSYYQACDVLVLNSTWEGTPNVVLEAMACGCPVIATDVSDIPRYVLPGRTGWLIPPDDIGALRSALEEAVRMPEAGLRDMGRMGREHLLSMGMDVRQMARRHEEFYVRLVES